MPTSSTRYIPSCDVFWVGSYPFKNPVSVCRKIIKNQHLLLHWPQLPKCSPRERLIAQTRAALKTKDRHFPKGYASGWNALWRLLKKSKNTHFQHFKTQMAGPITLFGKLNIKLSKKNSQRKLLRFVSLWLEHAFWQIHQIQQKDFTPILMLDEPHLPSYMGQTGSQQSRKTLRLLRSIILRLQKKGALVGVHCCNRISPANLISLNPDMIHFNVYHFPSQLKNSKQSIQAYLKNGGIIAWGVIPTLETLDSTNKIKIEKLLMESLEYIEGQGMSLRHILNQSMVAPTCGTGLLTVEESNSILDFATQLSVQLKSRYKLED